MSGVGGNTARMILSAFTADEVRTIIAAGQADVLKSVKGLGIKTAQKIIVELRDKIGAVCPANEALPLRQAADGTFDEALSALTMLGFARQASEKALRALRKEMPAATVEEPRETSAQAPVRNFVGCVARVNLTRLLQVYAILFYFCCRI